MANKHQMNIALPAPLVERLDELADEMELTRSEVARLILAQYLCGKLELRIDDQSATERLAKMAGRWPRKTRRTRQRSKRS